MTPPEQSSGGRAAARRAARGQSAPGGSGRRKQKPTGRRRATRIAMGVGAFAVLVAAAGCAWIYQLDSNIKHSALDTGSQPQKGAVIPGALNIMVIGSASPATACR